MGAEVGGLTVPSAPTAIEGDRPQLIEAVDGDTAVRLRTVRNAAPPSAPRAIVAAAPIAALSQSNPSSVLAGEPETSVGSLGSGPARELTDE